MQYSIESGKIPPQAIDLEKAVLGALLQYKTAPDEVFMIMRKPEVFYKPEHQCIFSAIYTLHNTGNQIDLLTVSEQLKAMKKLEAVGGDYYLIELTQRVTSAAHVEYHTRILLQKFIKRNIILFNARVTSLAYDELISLIGLMARSLVGFTLQ